MRIHPFSFTPFVFYQCSERKRNTIVIKRFSYFYFIFTLKRETKPQCNLKSFIICKFVIKEILSSNPHRFHTSKRLPKFGPIFSSQTSPAVKIPFARVFSDESFFHFWNWQLKKWFSDQRVLTPLYVILFFKRKSCARKGENFFFKYLL